MSQQLSRQRFNITGLSESGKARIKDSLLVAIVFLIGLLGTCYILHFAASGDSSTGYQMEHSQPYDGAEPEAIYVTQK